MASISVTGVGSGLDIGGLVQQLVQAERAGDDARLTAREAKASAQLSAYGSLKSVMGQFQTKLTALENPDLYTGMDATASEPGFFTASAEADAVPGSYSVEVQALASRHKIASQAYTDAGTVVGTGDLTFTVNDDAFTVAVASGSDSLDAIRDAVNAAEDNSGVSASIVTDQHGAHLVFSSSETGAENAIEVSVSNATGTLGQLAFDPLAMSNPMTEQVAAADSVIEVDGFTATSANTEFASIIQGVTLDVIKAEPGTVLELKVAADTESVRSAVLGFVSGYNALRTVLNDLSAFNPENNTAGLLQGDSTVRSITENLRRDLSASVSGVSVDFDTLAEFGITSSADNGLLELDSAKLSEVINANFAEIGAFFNNADGLATRFSSTLDGYIGDTGLLESRSDGLQLRIDQVADQRIALDRRIAVIEARFLQQFTALDTLLGELNNTSSFLTNQLDNLPGSTFKGNS